MIKLVTESQTTRELLEKLDIVPIDIFTSKTRGNFTVKVIYSTNKLKPNSAKENYLKNKNLG